MIDQIRAMIWKEWKEVLLQRDRSRTDRLLRTSVAVSVFAILVWRVGMAFVDRPSLLLMPAFILVFCVIAIVADSFAGERERHTLETLLASRISDDAILIGKIASAMVLVWGLMFMMLIAGLVEVNLMRSADGILIFPMHRVISTLAFTFLACLFVSCVGVFVSLHTSTVRQATQVLNIGFMVLGFATLYASISLPQEWRMKLAQAFTTDNLMRTEFSAAILVFIIDLVCLAAARLSFRRHKSNLV
jgi:ABC-2 type transport system permease protein